MNARPLDMVHVVSCWSTRMLMSGWLIAMLPCLVTMAKLPDDAGLSLNENGAAASSEDWWNDAWSYRRSFIVTNANAMSLSQYQVVVQVAYEPGMQDNYGDLRFVDAQGQELSHWIEEKTYGLGARVWVKMPVLQGASATPVTLYFGNDQAVSASSFDATMTKNPAMPGLLGCWHMDEGSGTNLVDASGNGNTMTLTGVNWVDADSRFGTGHALSFAGTLSSYAMLRPVNNIAATQFTVALWMKTTDTNRTAGIVSYATASSDNEILIFNQQSIAPHVRNAHTNSNIRYNEGDWTHLAMTWRSSDGRVVLYKNGVLVFTNRLATGITLTSGGALVLGQEQDTVGGGFDVAQAFSGWMDEVRLYNRALTDAEVLALASFREVAPVEPVVTWNAQKEANGWWDVRWLKRHRLVVDHTQIDHDLTNFPVLVRLTAESYDFSAGHANGYDVRFVLEDGTLLDYERERHDAATQKAEYWVRLPLVSSTADTTFLVYYGHPAAADGANAAGVWDEGFAGVWHMADAADSLSVPDSTSPGNPALKSEPNGPSPSSGRIGPGQYFDGSNDRMSMGNASRLNSFGALTVSAWIDLHALGRRNSIAEKHQSPSAGWWWNVEADNKLKMVVVASGSNRVADTDLTVTSGWTFVSSVYDGSNILHAINGVPCTGTQSGTGKGSIVDTTNGLVAGVARWVPIHFHGGMDELRISSTARSLAWLKAEYHAGAGTLLVIGEEENVYSWWNTDWSHRRVFTVDAAKIDESLTNFPVLVRLTPNNFDFGTARADGFDLRFVLADGTTLDYERERHDAAAQKAEYWVRLPLVSSAEDSVVYLYYGNMTAPDGENASGVWDSHVRARYGMNDATSLQVNDSTTNNNHAAKVAVNQPQATEGMDGWAQAFNGTSDFLAAPHTTSLNLTTAITVNAWVYKPGSWEAAYQKMIGKCRPNPAGDYAYGLSQGSLPHGTFFFLTISGTLRSISANNHPEPDAWHHLVGTYDGVTMKYYIDGSMVASANYTGTLTGNTHPLRIGHAYNEEYFRGRIDDVRVCDVARSPAWIKADYHAGMGTLLTASSAETLKERHVISGVVRDAAGGQGVAGVALLDDDGTTIATTDGNGFYAFEYEPGWIGKVMPVFSNSVFTPSSRSYTSVVESQMHQDFTMDTGIILGPGCLGGSFAEAVDACYFSFTQGGHTGWGVQSGVTKDGVSAVKSGAIGHSQESWMQTTVTGPGTLTFWWKVSSESCCDPLTFYINGISKGDIRGSIDWQQKTFAIAAGTHTLKWRYSKDGSVASGSDAGYVDRIMFVPATITASLSNMTQDYTGAPRVPTVITDPPGYPYALTYDSLSNAPIEAGSYTVAVSVLGEVKATGMFVIQAPAYISGRVINAYNGTPIGGLRMEFSNGESVFTDEAGTYAKMLRSGWNGVLRPADMGNLRYEPAVRVYEAISGAITEQDFSMVPAFSVMQASPTGRVTQVLRSLDITFFKDVNLGTFTTDDVTLTGPAGAIIPTAVSAINATTVRVTIPPQSEDGVYNVVIGPAIQSVDGELLDQNLNGTGGEAEDVYAFSFTLDRAMDIVAIHPATGPTFGGTAVTITGLGLTGGYGSGVDGDVTVNEDINLSTGSLVPDRTCPDAVSYAVIELTDTTATLSEAPAAGCLVAGDEVLLINLQGASSASVNAGHYEYLRVAGVSGPVVRFTRSKLNFYGDGATSDANVGVDVDQQKVVLQRVPHYRNVTVASNRVMTAAAWDGTKGGVLCFRASGTVINNGVIHMDAKGYRGGLNTFAGESWGQASAETQTANWGGGGRGAGSSCHIGGAGGGGHGQHGMGGYSSTCDGALYYNGAGNSGQGGFSYGVSNLARIYPGSGGGGGVYNTIATNGVGGAGGGIVMISGNTIQNNGVVRSAGGRGTDADYLTPRGTYSDSGGGGGGGSGGSILMYAESYLLVTNSFGIDGGAGGIGRYNGKNSNGGTGAVGRVALLYTRERPEEGLPPNAYVESAPGAVSVFFGTNRAWSVTSLSATTIVAITPPGEIGSVDVTVEVGGHGEVTSEHGFTYVVEEDLLPPVAPVILNYAMAPATNDVLQPPVQLLGTRVELSDVWVNGVKCANQGEGAWSYQDTNMTSGVKEYLVHATDPAGNTSDVVRVLVKVAYDRVFDANATISATNSLYDGMDILISGATLIVDGAHNFGRVVVTNGGKITGVASPSLSVTNKVHIEANYLYLSSNSSIDVTGQGWTGTNTTGGAGGSHGGLGGAYSSSQPPALYGDYLQPESPGFGGARSNASQRGGGVIRVVADTLILDGYLRANGAGSNTGAQGAGAGGSIWVDVDQLRGIGGMQAHGGNQTYYGGGGGGGRIAVYYGDGSDFNLTNCTANGGNGHGGGGVGGVGTVHLENRQAVVSVVHVTPSVWQTRPLTSVVVQFNVSLDAASLTASDLVLNGPSGSLPLAGVTMVDALTCSFQLAVPAVEEGTYSYLIGPDILSSNALPMTSAHYGEFQLDLTPPAMPIVTNYLARESGTNLLKSTSVTVRGTREPDVAIWINGSQRVSAGTGPWAATLTLGQGLQTLSVSARDASGHVSLTNTVVFLIDTVAPAIGVSSPAHQAYLPSSPAQVTLAYTEAHSGLDLDATIKSLKRGGVTAMPGDWSATANQLIFTPQGDLLDGTYAVEAQLRDRLGNSSALHTWSFTVDTVPPDPPVINPVTSPTTISQQLISGTREPYSAVLCNGSTVSVASSSTTWSWAAPLQPGLNTFAFSLRDRAGNLGESATVTVQYNDVAPGPVTVTAAVYGVGTSLTLHWPGYDELAHGGDIVRYTIYQHDQPFSSPAGATVLGARASGQQSFVVNGLERQVTRYYAVEAEDSAGLKSPTLLSIAAAPVDVAPPADVTSLAFEPGWTNGWLRWSPSADNDEDLAGYRIVYHADGLTNEVTGLTTQLLCTGLAPATSYLVRVRTVDESGNLSSGFTGLVYTLVQNPTQVVATPYSGVMDLAWTSSTPIQNVSYYRIYCSATSFTNLTGLTPALTVTGLSASVAGLVNNANYYFAVAAVNKSGGYDPAVTPVSGMPRPDLEGPAISTFTYAERPVTNDMPVTRPAHFRVEAADRAGLGLATLTWNGQTRAMAPETATRFSTFWNIVEEADGPVELLLRVQDSFGNATMLTSTVIVAMGPPTNAPVISSPANNSAVNTPGILLAGTADPYAQHVHAYRGGERVGSAPVLSDGSFTIPLTLIGGTNRLRVAAESRGGEGPLSAERSIKLDASIPAAPSGISAQAQPGGVVRLTWWQPLGVNAKGYRLYRSTSSFVTTNEATRVGSPLLAGTSFDDLPPTDGTYYYRLSTVNDVNTEGALSAEVNAVADGTAPYVSEITYSTTGPLQHGIYGTGVVSFVMQVSEKLQAAPFFNLVRTNGLPVTPALVQQSDTRYTGSFTLRPGMGAGALLTSFSGRDPTGNRGTEVLSGHTLVIDTEGPVATSLSVQPGHPLRNDSANPVQVHVTLAFSGYDRPVGTPALSYRLSASQTNPVAISLGPVTLNTYGGQFTLPASAGLTNEHLVFTYEGYDALGNRGTMIVQQPEVLVYQGALPPAESPWGLTATAAPGGQVNLAWHAAEDASGYALLRQAPGEATLQPLTVTESAAWVDHAPEGLNWYAVASIRSADGASVTSAVSDSVSVLADSTPPGAPQQVQLLLYGKGLAATWDKPATESLTYRLYRAGTPIANTAGLTPLIANIVSTNAVDAAPITGPAFYAVTALDAVGNESVPSPSVYTNLSLLPVNTLTVQHLPGQAPLVSWAHPSPAGLAGYNLYVGSTGLEVRVNNALISRITQNWVDEGYTEGNRWYGVAAEDGVREGVVRSLLSPALRTRLITTNSLKRGWMNRLDYAIINDSGLPLHNLKLEVGVGTRLHVSDPFSLAVGVTSVVPVVVGGYTNLPDLVTVTNTLLYSPNSGERVSFRWLDARTVQPGSLVMTVQHADFVRGAQGTVRFTLYNTSDEEIELLTARNRGGAASPDIQCRILNDEGMVYASAAYKQLTGDALLTLANGDTLARIPAGGSFESGPVTVNLPDALPDRVVVQMQIDNVYYHYSEPTQVKLNGLTGRTVVDMRDTSYYVQITNLTPRVSTGVSNIVIQGVARQRLGDLPAARVAVKLILAQAGFDRVISLTTDDQGIWSYSFMPTAGDAGVFSVYAQHPTLTSRTAGETFTIQRVSVSPTRYVVSCPRGFAAPIAVMVGTGPGSVLTNLTLQYRAEDQAGGVFPADLEVRDIALLPVVRERSSARLTAVFRAGDNAPAEGQLVLRVVSGDEVWGVVLVPFTLAGQLTPNLTWTPSFIETGVAISNRQVEKVTVRNTGYRALSNAVVSLVSTGGVAAPSWVSLVSSATRDTLQPGESWPLELSFQPGPDVPLTTLTPNRFTLRVTSDNHGAIEVPVWVHVDASGLGSALIKVTDLYTGTIGTNGQVIAGVAGAKVRFVKQEGLLYETNVVADALGEALVSRLPVGLYSARVSAPDHSAASVNVWIKPGVTVVESVHLPMSLITVEWNVTPTTIQDVYSITLNATYVTKVPAAVVAVEPRSLPVPNMQAGEVFNGEITLQNLGLIRAEKLRFNLPPSDGYYRYELLRPVPTELEASQIVRIPYRVTCIQPFGQETAGGGGGCFNYNNCGEIDYEYCCINGVIERIGSDAACVAKSICGEGTPPSTFGGGTGGTGGYGFGGSGIGGGSGGASSVIVAAPVANNDPVCAVPPEREDIDPEADCDITKVASETGSHVEVLLRSYNDRVTDFSIPVLNDVINVKRFFTTNTWSFRIGPHEDIKFHAERVMANNQLVMCDGWYIDENGAVRMTGCDQPDMPIFNPLDHPEALTYRNRIVKQLLDGGCVIYASSDGGMPGGTAGQGTFVGTTEDAGDIARDARSEYFDGCSKYRWYDRNGNWAVFDGLELVRYGDRNNVTVHVLRDEKRRISGFADHFTNQVVWMSYLQIDADGKPVTAATPSYLAAVQDAHGRGVTYQYDNRARLTNVVVLGAQHTAYTYGAYTNGQSVMLSKRTPDGKVTRISYDARGYVTGVSNNVGGSWSYQFSYDSARDRYYAQIRDAAGPVEERWYGKQGQLIGRALNGVLSMAATNDPPGYTFDEYYNVVAIHYDEGFQDTWTYKDLWPWPVSAHSWDGASVTNTYDAQYNLVRETTRRGTNIMEDLVYTYDAFGKRLTMTAKGQGEQPDLTWRWTYDEAWRPVTVTDPWGNIQSNRYDTLGRLIHARLLNGGEWSYTYDNAGNLLTVRDPAGGVVSNRYDMANRKVWSRDPRGIEVWNVYATNGLLSAISNSLGHVVRRTYDTLGRVVRDFDALGQVVEYQYDAAGNQRVVGVTPVMQRDAQGRVHQMTLPSGEHYTFTFDEETGLVNAMNMDGLQLAFEHDAVGQVTRMTAEADDITRDYRWEYNTYGALTRVEGPEGRQQQFTYDEKGSLIRAVNALGYTNRFSVDTDRGEYRIIDPRGATNRLQYSLADLRAKVIYPDGTEASTVRDATARVREQTLPGGRTVRMRRDVMQRLQGLDYYATPQAAQPEKSVWFSRDVVGRITGYGYSNEPARVTVAYDDVLRKETTTVDFGPFAASYTYTYDRLGRRVGYTDPLGDEHTYTYGDDQELASVTLPGGGIIRMERALRDRRATIYWPGGVTQTITADRFGSIRTNRLVDPAGQDVLRLLYEVNNAGEITNININGQSGRRYTYDAGGALMQGTTEAGSNSFTYDGNRNRRGSRDDPASWQYDAMNRLISRPGAAYTYNTEGAMTQRVVHGVSQSFHYDAAGHMVEIRNNGALLARYTYDPVGNRIAKDVQGEITYYLYGREGLLAEFDQAGGVIRTYAYAPGQLWMQAPLYVKTGGQLYYPARDHHGMAEVLVAENGSIVWSGVREAYGRYTVDAASLVDLPLRFSGQYEDQETGLHYNTHRYYDPDTGRYLTPDPMGLVDGVNRYQFAFNDPVNQMDPWGLYGADIHFYATYIVGRKLGMSRHEAYELAYYAQYPDMDARLDAISAPKRLAGNSYQDRFSTYSYAVAVQSAFHMLHGKGKKYTLCSRCILERKIKTEKDVAKRGMMVHIFQDTYGHMKIDRVKVPSEQSEMAHMRGNHGYGLYRWDNHKTESYRPIIGHGLDGNDPDLIILRPELTKQSLRDLYLILGGDDPSSLKDLDDMIDELVTDGLKDSPTKWLKDATVEHADAKMRKFAIEKYDLNRALGYGTAQYKENYDPHRMYDPYFDKKAAQKFDRPLMDADDLYDFVHELHKDLQKQDCK